MTATGLHWKPCTCGIADCGVFRVVLFDAFGVPELTVEHLFEFQRGHFSRHLAAIQFPRAGTLHARLR